jgi:hypothetical protein
MGQNTGGGRERSEREWRRLLEASGFVLTRVYPVGGDTLMVRNVGIVEARPAAAWMVNTGRLVGTEETKPRILSRG